MTPHRGLVGAALVCGVMLFLAAPAAQAVDSVADFEGPPPGTAVTTQYSNLGGAGMGVSFGTFFGEPQGVVPEVITVAAGSAQSGVHVGYICQSCGKEFSETQTYGRFATTKHLLRVYVGTPGSTPLSSLGVHLTAYGVAGGALGTVSANAPLDGTVKTKLEFSDAPGRIAYFRVYPDNFLGAATPQLSIDDVTFDQPAVAAVPDFGLSVPANQFFGSALGVNTGKSASLAVHVDRVNGSSGPLSFSATGLPSGTTASFTADNAADPASVQVKFSAAANATPASDAPVKIIATPTTATSDGPGKAPRTTTINLTVLGTYDLRVTGIEVTQGVQTIATGANTLPTGAPAQYTGVTLVANAKTVARVFANLKQPAGGSVGDVPALLFGTKNGKALPGSPLTPDTGSKTLTSGPSGVGIVERAKTTNAYEFTLPTSWTSGSISLKAQVTPPDVLFGPTEAECTTAGCAANNTFQLKSIPFFDDGFIKLGPVALTVAGDPALPKPSKAFAEAVNLTPMATGELRFDANNYISTIDITDIHNATTQGALVPACSTLEAIGFLPAGYCATPTSDGDDFKDGFTNQRLKDQTTAFSFCHLFIPNVDLCPDIVVGVNRQVARGVSNGGVSTGFLPVSVVQANRPLTSVAHELGHDYGRPHASAACGGGGEAWPPDELGYLQGVGLDRRSGSGGANSKYRVIVPRSASGLGSTNPSAADFNPQSWFDFMSYCTAYIAPDLDSWISPKGWNDTFKNLAVYNVLVGRLPGGITTSSVSAGSAAAVATDGLNVSAFALADGPIIVTKVGPEHDVAPVSKTPSLFHVRLTDAAGATLVDAPMAQTEGHINRGAHVLQLDAHVTVPGLSASAAAPAVPAAVAGLSIMRGTTTVMTRQRSPHAPTVKVLSPTAATTVRAGALAARWQAGDADGDALSTRVEFSADDGRTWRVVFGGANAGAAQIPRRALTATRLARLRVVVNDGFDSATAISARFVVSGAAPIVTIATPSAGDTLRSDRPVSLVGGAVDDAGRALPGTTLTWTQGGRRLGRGSSITAAALAPGTRTISLRARDRNGRKATASVRVKVTAATPQFLTLKAPARVRRSARRLTLRVAANEFASLAVGGPGVTSRRDRVGRRVRTITVRVRPGSAQLRVALHLRAYGLQRKVTLVVERG